MTIFTITKIKTIIKQASDTGTIIQFLQKQDCPSEYAVWYFDAARGVNLPLDGETFRAYFVDMPSFVNTASARNWLRLITK